MAQSVSDALLEELSRTVSKFVNLELKGGTEQQLAAVRAEISQCNIRVRKHLGIGE